MQGISVRCRNCVLCNDLAVAAEIVLGAANKCSLSKIYVVCKELAFAAEIVFCAVNQCSLPNCVLCNELAFTAEIVLGAAN